MMWSHWVLRCDPMRVFSFLSICLATLFAGAAMAQSAVPASPSAASVPTAAAEAAAGRLVQGGSPALPSFPPATGERPPWRQLSGYAFPALADTVSSLQNMNHAMQLRDYCADGRIEDEFVRDRLARFSQITGREEDCSSLLRY